MSEDLNRQLQELKALTARTGALHEAQVLQMKIWPLLLFGDHAKVKTEVVVGKTVKYSVTSSKVDPKVEPTDRNRYAGVLSNWTKELLGDSYRVSVILDGEKLNVTTRKGRKAKPEP